MGVRSPTGKPPAAAGVAEWQKFRSAGCRTRPEAGRRGRRGRRPRGGAASRAVAPGGARHEHSHGPGRPNHAGSSIGAQGAPRPDV